MEKNRPSIVFIFIDCMGGIPSFYWNLINHSKLIKNFQSKVVLLKADVDKRPRFLDKFSADEVVHFDYSVHENQHYVRARLNNVIGTGPGLVVTDNGLPIQTCTAFKNPKTVCHLIHDFYYVNQDIQFTGQIDFSIAHSSFFSDAVFASNPSVNFGRTFYIPYGVQAPPEPTVKHNKELKLVFLGRLDEGKGVSNLFFIDEQLKQNGIAAQWTIIGKGPLRDFLHKQWQGQQNVTFEEPASTQEVYGLLKHQDIFVFPTLFEGTPVSILECLANGVVTITHDLPGGIRDIVTEGVGFRCKVNELHEFVQHIVKLNSDRNLLTAMQNACTSLFQRHYNILDNADKYFEKFLEFEKFKRTETKAPSRSALLDRSFIPNFIVKIIRRIK